MESETIAIGSLATDRWTCTTVLHCNSKVMMSGRFEISSFRAAQSQIKNN